MDWDLVRNALEGDGGELGLWGTYDLAQLLALRLVSQLVSQLASLLVSLLVSQLVSQQAPLLALHQGWLVALSLSLRLFRLGTKSHGRRSARRSLSSGV